MSNLAQPLPSAASQSQPSADWLATVRQKVESVKYGSLKVVVHDGRISLIEKTDILFIRSPKRSS